MKLPYPHSKNYTEENLNFFDEEVNYTEELFLDDYSLENLNFFDEGENYIELYNSDTFVGNVEVWTDSELEEEYIIINNEIIYLYNLKRN